MHKYPINANVMPEWVLEEPDTLLKAQASRDHLADTSLIKFACVDMCIDLSGWHCHRSRAPRV